MTNHNAAIYLLSSRVKLLEDCLFFLNKNWNHKYNYPIYVHYFDDIYTESFKKKIKDKISKNIFFHQIDYSVPKHIDEKDLFYNRKYLKYVRESFSKKRIGYLHMEHFVVNITSFGQKGCLVKDLEKFDKLLRIDDDSFFKSEINFDLFDFIENNPFASGYTWSKYDYRVKDTRECLWKFYKKYVKEKKIIPKNNQLKIAIEKDDEKLMHDLQWSAGNLNLYNMKYFKNNSNWKDFTKSVNEYGGTYKHRWGDIPCIGLFAYTFFDKPILDLKLKDKNVYDNKFPSIYSSVAPSVNSYFNLHHFPLLKWYHQFKKFIK
jgi:hypothetical protein